MSGQNKDTKEEVPEDNGDDFEFGNFDGANFDDDSTPAVSKNKGKKGAKESAATANDENSENGAGKPPSSRDASPEEAKDDASENAKIKEKMQDGKSESDRKSLSSSSSSAHAEDNDVADASKVEAEVCEAFFAWVDSWNSGNLFGYLDAYWDSDQTRYISEGLASGNHAKGGVVITGRRDIDKVFTEVFVKMKKQQEKQRVKKGVAGLLTLRKLLVTPTGNNNAIVFGENQLELAGDKRGHPSRAGVFTIHVRRIKDGNGEQKWRIVSEHHTELPNK